MRRVRRVLLLALCVAACGRKEPAPAFVGSARCIACHADAGNAWRRSQHAAAMEEATPKTMLGRFDGTTFTHEGVTSTFRRDGERYVVETEGEDGKLHSYQVRYTFGVYPLQQYLVAFPGGRMQALSMAWDSRPAPEGQRWFFLFPGPRITHTDELHWTGRRQNWNYMCADCHATAVRKGYVADAETFHTTYSELGVGCEGCHGPGSRHASGSRWSWMRKLTRAAAMPARIARPADTRWVLDSGARIARRVGPAPSLAQPEMCAQCHARRFHIAEGYSAGKPLLDYYIPMLLERGQYYPDGQQREEVYTFASFLQSRMFAAGVTCSDCHEPHSSKLCRPGNATCTTCHAAAAYDVGRHTMHAKGTTAALCTTCHMPTRTFMVVDPRHDHSMRVPRPDRAATLGVPEPCTGCHTGKDARWAAERIRATRANASPGFQSFAETFAADEAQQPQAAEGLARIVGDTSQPALVRASALSRLADYGGDVAVNAARASIANASPLMRLAAMQVLEGLPARTRTPLAIQALGDSTRAVRQAAAWLLAADTSLLRNDAQRAAFGRAAAEFIGSQRYNADQPESRLSLGVFQGRLGDLAAARRELEAALRIAPSYAPAAEMLQRINGNAGVRKQ